MSEYAVENHLFTNAPADHPEFLEAFDQVQGQFVVAAAKALFADAWARSNDEAVEQFGDKGYVSLVGPGQDVFDVMPPVPHYAYFAAAHFMGIVEAGNGSSIPVLVTRALVADDKQDDFAGEEFWAYVREFAHCKVMEALGQGVSWEDDHEPIEFFRTGYDPIDLAFDHDPLAKAEDFYSVDDDDL